MQRDMDLIREILQCIVDNKKIDTIQKDASELRYHLDLMYDAGFLLYARHDHLQQSNSVIIGCTYQLSWQGQEYYAAIQDKSVWDKIPNGVKMAPIEIIKGVAIELIKAQLIT